MCGYGGVVIPTRTSVRAEVSHAVRRLSSPAMFLCPVPAGMRTTTTTRPSPTSPSLAAGPLLTPSSTPATSPPAGQSLPDLARRKVRCMSFVAVPSVNAVCLCLVRAFDQSLRFVRLSLTVHYCVCYVCALTALAWTRTTRPASKSRRLRERAAPVAARHSLQVSRVLAA
jgi:hypothetical protein